MVQFKSGDQSDVVLAGQITKEFFEDVVPRSFITLLVSLFEKPNLHKADKTLLEQYPLASTSIANVSENQPFDLII